MHRVQESFAEEGFIALATQIANGMTKSDPERP